MPVIMAAAKIPALIASGRARIGVIPPRALVAVTRLVPVIFVFRGRIDAARGRGIVLPRIMPFVAVTHPVIVLPTSAVLFDNGMTSAELAGS